jgi:hypothetical protein
MLFDNIFHCLSCVIGVAIVAALALALGLYFGLLNEQDIEGATGIDVPSLPPFFFQDPFQGVPQESTAKWASSGTGGLALTIIDYTSDDWQGYFDTAVSDWDNGTPDALTLSTQDMSYNQACDYEDGVMIVCNSDYGETGWKGLNEYMVTSDNIIVNSRAKMNEYYLAGASEAEHQYVMCHEIGHGFGLAHTDESFVNKNLGNCLDYTNNFTTEQILPGEVNYLRLEEKYGVVERRGLVAEPEYGNGKKTLPSWVYEEYEERHAKTLQRGNIDEMIATGWVKLDESPMGAEFALALGDGYYVRAAMLHAN